MWLNWMLFLIFLFTTIDTSYLNNFVGEINPKEIVRISQEKLQGENAFATIKMKIVRPGWQRELELKSWSKGQKLSLLLVTSPARDKGVAFLKRNKEIWNWQPSIDRVIKLPPSMMSQSWMGSDFTNDDLVEHSSLVDDFTHEFINSEIFNNTKCYKIRLTAKENAAVVWDEIVMWIDQKDYMQLKVEFYDDEKYLISTMYGKEPKDWNGRLLPSILEVIPSEDPGNRTIIEYLDLNFNVNHNDRFFSLQNLKRVR